MLFCDTDVIFRSPLALANLASAALEHDAALIGEVRVGANAMPDIQASFFAVRRDVYARRDIRPLVHGGAPAYLLQRSIWDSGLPVVHLPTNKGGLILHRGRSGVEAAHRYRPLHQYASARGRGPHYMGIPDGPAVWAEVESRYASLLEEVSEPELIGLLDDAFRALAS